MSVCAVYKAYESVDFFGRFRHKNARFAPQVSMENSSAYAFLHFSEQYLTASQFFAQLFRHVISRPQRWQGLLGKLNLFPQN
jgi:hypothetical protein